MSAPTRSTPAAAYFDRLLESVTKTAGSLRAITLAAETAAQKTLDGGELWFAGDAGFVREAAHRAGGLMHAEPLADTDEASAGDVVLLGSLPGDDAEDVALLQAMRERDALVVFFAPENLPGEHVFVDAFAPPANDPDRLPTISPALAAGLWAFTGELVAAITRQGRMPPMYKSVSVPGGPERNAQHQGLRWEPLAVSPVGPHVLGGTYLDRLLSMMRRLQATQMDKFAEAGQMAARTLQAGNTVWYASAGHLPPEQPGQVGDPGLLEPLPAWRTPERLPTVLKPGDLLVYVGYYEPFGPWAETAHQYDAKIVTVLAGTPARRAEEMGADLNIDGCWPYGDAAVHLPGYDVGILPPSGVIQSAAYWMIVGETAARLKNE